METEVLDREIKKFHDVRASLMRENPRGGYVVIKGDEVLGVWMNRLDALKEGFRRYGDVPFLVREIRQGDALEDFIYFTATNPE